MLDDVDDDVSDELTQIEDSASFGFEVYVLRQIANPFRLSWVLIRLGHEPFPPVKFYSPLALLGWRTPILVYPNVFQYVYYTIRELGVWRVISTGVFASACMDFISQLFHRVSRYRSIVWDQWLKDPHGTEVVYTDWDIGARVHRRAEPFQVERQMGSAPPVLFLTMLFEATSIRAWEVLITHPFYVVMVRQVAALIGGEEQYNWFPVAVRSVYRESGPLGFFQGLVPRLASEVITTVVYYSFCRILRRIFGTSKKRAGAVNILQVLAFFALRNYVYSLELAGCIMSVRGSKLAGAAEANSFSGWRECERFLVHSGQSNRGWFPFLRSHIQAKDLPD
ncbi:Mitochondrial carrier 2 [Fasciolopsis buskii]|uniref:Mitochondrial carrier 2 n=1 Tax=Fasciolopsis buskii TaxID=27845 RepID=A0A8E0RTU0_9TREM|nr:Mitochondrial carrier 2 [Fasciolopsis buski]